MAIPQPLLDYIEEGRQIILAQDSPEVLETAKNIAFYATLIFAAPEDASEDEEQKEVLDHLSEVLQGHLETYQHLTNDLL